MTLRWIPRREMPQVDEANLVDMVRDAVESIGAPGLRVMDPHKLHAHQRGNHAKAGSMTEQVRRKPIVVSSDGFVVDGNHRAYANRIHNELTVAIELPVPFDEACRWLFTLPYVYHLAPDTPVRN